jgi:hypothetical protein
MSAIEGEPISTESECCCPTQPTRKLIGPEEKMQHTPAGAGRALAGRMQREWTQYEGPANKWRTCYRDHSSNDCGDLLGREASMAM